MRNTLVSIKPAQPLSLATLMSLKTNITGSLAILSHANQNILQIRRDNIMPSLSKVFKQLHNNVSKDYCLGMRLISTLWPYPKHWSRLLNINHMVDMMKNTQDPTKITTATKTSQKFSSPFWKYQAALLGRRTKSSIKQRNMGVSLSNLDMKDISHKVEGRKV